MAKLLSYYNLCPGSIGKDFLGVSQDVDAGSVINTLDRNMIIVMKLSYQKQIASWTTLDRLSAKVVYDFTSKQYVGVFMNRFIRSWDASCPDVNRVKKKKFNKNIFDLFTIKDHESALVLYENGNCESFERALDNRKKVNDDQEEVVAEGWMISNVSFFRGPSDSILITYTVINKENPTEIEQIYFNLDPVSYRRNGSIHRIKIERPELSGKLVGCAVVEGFVYPSLCTIWSDSRVFMQQLRYSDDDENSISIGQFVSLMSNLNLEKPISVMGISCDYIAVYGCCSGQEGANLLLYNTKFRLVQTKQFFKTFFNNSRLWVIGNNIFLGFGELLSVIPFRISKEQLCDMIGAQKVTDFSNYVDKEYINEEYDLEEGLYFDGDHQTELNTMNHDRTIYPLERKNNKKPIISIDYCPEVMNVDKMIASFQDMDILVDMIRVQNAPTDSIQTKFYSNPDGLLIMSEEFELFCNELERCGSSEIEITEHLIPLLIETNHISDLIVCLKKYNNISEKMIVRSIKYCLDLIQQRPDDEVNLIRLLNNILSCSYNAEIFHYIRAEIDITQTIYLFKHLLKLLNDESGENLFYRPSTTGDFDEDLIIFKWLITLIDAQYQKLILSSDREIYNILNETLKFVNRIIDAGKAANSLAVNLYKLINRNDKAADEMKFSKWYTIEKIKLY